MKQLRSEVSANLDAEAQFMAKNYDELTISLTGIESGLNDSLLDALTMKRFGFIHKGWPYMPVRSDLYRYLALQAKQINTDTVAAGDVITIIPSNSVIQSWTTSPKIAARIFSQHKVSGIEGMQSRGDRFAIVRFADKGKQVFNIRWLNFVADRIALITKNKSWATGTKLSYNQGHDFYRLYGQPFRETMRKWTYQDEVGLFTGGKGTKSRVVVERVFPKLGK